MRLPGCVYHNYIYYIYIYIYIYILCSWSVVLNEFYQMVSYIAITDFDAQYMLITQNGILYCHHRL